MVVAAALGAVAYAAQTLEEEKLRWAIRYENGTTLDVEAEKRAETPLWACVAAILNYKEGVGLMLFGMGRCPREVTI